MIRSLRYSLHSNLHISQDRTEPLDWMDLSDGRVKDIKDPDDSYCELHAIANSFAVEFYGDGPWFLFSDTCGEKVRH